jgi:hypothetical protein
MNSISISLDCVPENSHLQNSRSSDNLWLICSEWRTLPPTVEWNKKFWQRQDIKTGTLNLRASDKLLIYISVGIECGYLSVFGIFDYANMHGLEKCLNFIGSSTDTF